MIHNKSLSRLCRPTLHTSRLLYAHIHQYRDSGTSPLNQQFLQNMLHVRTHHYSVMSPWKTFFPITLLLLASLTERELILLLNILTKDKQAFCKIFLLGAPTTALPLWELSILQHLLSSISVILPIFHFLCFNCNSLLNPCSSLYNLVGGSQKLTQPSPYKFLPVTFPMVVMLSLFFWKWVEQYH